MDVREKLVELIGQVQDCGCDVTDVVKLNYVENITLADRLIANGVTVQYESDEIKQLKNQVVALKKSNRNWRRKVQRMRNSPQPPKGE